MIVSTLHALYATVASTLLLNGVSLSWPPHVFAAYMFYDLSKPLRPAFRVHHLVFLAIYLVYDAESQFAKLYLTEASVPFYNLHRTTAEWGWQSGRLLKRALAVVFFTVFRLVWPAYIMWSEPSVPAAITLCVNLCFATHLKVNVGQLAALALIPLILILNTPDSAMTIAVSVAAFHTAS